MIATHPSRSRDWASPQRMRSQTEAETAVPRNRRFRSHRHGCHPGSDGTLTLTGTLDPREGAGRLRVSARLLRILKTEGDRVVQGAVIAVLDDTDFRLAHDRAKASSMSEANRAHARARRACREPAEDRRHHGQGTPGCA